MSEAATTGVPTYTLEMGKHLVDLDERALADAQRALGTTTMKDTVNQALRLAAESGTDDTLAAERGSLD